MKIINSVSVMLLILLLLLLLLLAGCSENENDDDPFINASLGLTCTFNPSNDSYFIQSLGWGIYLNNNDPIAYNGGDMIISNKRLEFLDEEDRWGPEGAQTYDGAKNDSIEPDFGQFTTWGLDGNDEMGIPQFSERIYTPKKIRIDYPIVNETVDIKNGLEIRWEEDRNNSKGVKIELYGDIEEGVFSSIFNELVEDDGKHLVNSEIFSNVPDSILIIISRQEKKIINKSNWNFKIQYYFRQMDFFELEK